MRPGAPTSKCRFVWRLSPFDVTWAIVAPFIALSMRDPALLDFVDGNALPNAYQYAGLTILFALPAFLFFRLSDGMSRFFSIGDIWSVLAATMSIVAGSSVTLFIINRLDGVPRSTPLIYGLVLAGGLFGGRALARGSRMDIWFDVDAKDATPPLRRVILVGIDRFAAIVIKLTDCQEPRTTQIVAALDPRERLVGRAMNGVKIVGRPGDLRAVLEEYLVHGVVVDEVWLADNPMLHADAARIEQQCLALGVKVCFISEALNLPQPRASVSGEMRPDAQIGVPHIGYFRFKRVLDTLVAATLIVLLSPLALGIAGLIYFDVGGPVIFWQRRIGQGGREFFVFKFRTFKAPYTKKGAPIAAEARLSKIGRAIRSTRLDEIPQLVNILRGDMSLIGPRPLLPIDQPDDPRLRLLVRPGVTGWAQVNGGTMVTPAEKDALDVWYIYHASPAIDLNVILWTLKIVFKGENKHQQQIDAAQQWYKRERQIAQRLFSDDAISTAKGSA